MLAWESTEHRWKENYNKLKEMLQRNDDLFLEVHKNLGVAIYVGDLSHPIEHMILNGRC